MRTRAKRGSRLLGSSANATRAFFSVATRRALGRSMSGRSEHNAVALARAADAGEAREAGAAGEPHEHGLGLIV